MTSEPNHSQKYRQRKRILGSLPTIMLLFSISAVIRFGEGAGLAFAAVSDPEQTPESCTPPPDSMALLRALQEREQNILKREGALADKRQALDIVEKRVQERLTSLISAENELASTLAIADKAAEQDIQRLVTVYENMKPKEAAPLFEAMAPDFAAGFLAKMNPETAAAIMSSIKPEAAYSISVIVAGRNARAPTN